MLYFAGKGSGVRIKVTTLKFHKAGVQVVFFLNSTPHSYCAAQQGMTALLFWVDKTSKSYIFSLYTAMAQSSVDTPLENNQITGPLISSA